MAVSFWLAFKLAARARGVRTVDQQRIRAALAKRLRTRLPSFLWPTARIAVIGAEGAAQRSGQALIPLSRTRLRRGAPEVAEPSEEAGGPVHALRVARQVLRRHASVDSEVVPGHLRDVAVPHLPGEQVRQRAAVERIVERRLQRRLHRIFRLGEEAAELAEGDVGTRVDLQVLDERVGAGEARCGVFDAQDVDPRIDGRRLAVAARSDIEAEEGRADLRRADPDVSERRRRQHQRVRHPERENPRGVQRFGGELHVVRNPALCWQHGCHFSVADHCASSRGCGDRRGRPQK